MPSETIRAFAARHGVSCQTVSNWKRKGLVTNAADGHIDVEASDARLAERPATYRGGTTRGPHGGATRGPQRSLAELSELLLADAERMMAKLIGDPL